ncbi:MAG: hypothetical protein M1820_004282 [Bogoriella megaspora]|nr:MAG: hypothetical protein M1820_004282 [Bogoriella megaspora]
MAHLIHHRSAPEKDLFIFKEPMDAEERELKLLGCAFVDRQRGTLGEFTPQGPPSVQSSADATKSEDVDAAPKPRVGFFEGFKAMIGYNPSVPNETLAGDHRALIDDALQQSINYDTPCQWPTDLVTHSIYPKKPTIAVGVQVMQERIKETHLRSTIFEIIGGILGVSTDEMEKTNIPILKRYNMESPEAKIQGLLYNDEYRKRVIKLFEHVIARKQEPRLFIATKLISCAQLSREWIEKKHAEAGVEAQDPTKTVPVKVEGKTYRVKHSTLQGAYQGSVVLCMGYHRIRYERQEKHQKQKFDELAQKFPRVDDPNIIDVFWIDDLPTKGTTVSFLQDEEEEVSAVRRVPTFGSELIETDEQFVQRSSQGEVHKSAFPDGFFGDDD